MRMNGLFDLSGLCIGTWRRVHAAVTRIASQRRQLTRDETRSTNEIIVIGEVSCFYRSTSLVCPIGSTPAKAMITLQVSNTSEHSSFHNE